MSIKIASWTIDSYGMVILRPLTVENGEQDIYIFSTVCQKFMRILHEPHILDSLQASVYK